MEKRKQIYLTVEQRLLEEAVTVPLVEDLSVWAMRNAVKGFKYNGWTYPVLGDLYIEK